MSDLHEIQKEIVLKSLPHINVSGWSMEALYQGAEDAGIQPSEVEKAFNGQTYKAIKIYNKYLLEMIQEQAFQDPGYSELGTTEKIKYLILLKFKLMTSFKGVAMATKAFFKIPSNLTLSPSYTWETVDKIWHIVGDTSTDFNYYTKRGILLGVYSTTLAYWLKTEDPELTATRAFLERRMEDSRKIAKVKHGMTAVLSPFVSCWKNFTTRS